MSVAVNGAAPMVAKAVSELLACGEVEPGSSVNVADGVVGWLVLEDASTSGVASERRCAVVGASGEVHAVGKFATVAVSVDPWGESMPVWAAGVAAAAWNAQRVGEELHTQRALWERRIQEAHEWADARGHCSEYDDLMDHLGLPRRAREFTLDVTASVDVRVRVVAASEDEARSALSDYELADAIRAMGRAELYSAISDREVTDVE